MRAPILLAQFNALICTLEAMPAHQRRGGLWLALRLLEQPALAPYLQDPLLPLEGEFLSLDSQRVALVHALELLGEEAPTLGALWGALYRPAYGDAQPCRVAVMALGVAEGIGWPPPEPVETVSTSVTRSVQAALWEALGLMERVGLPPPRPVQLLYGVEGGSVAAGDSLGLPLFLAILSTLTGLVLQPRLGATGALASGRLVPVDWVAAKQEALTAAGLRLLSPDDEESLAAAAQRALVGGEIFGGHREHPVPPLVAQPTFLSADLEPEGELERREVLAAFEATVCAALEREGGFIFRSQAAVEEGIRAAFATPEAACAAAIAVQQGLLRRPWPAGQAPLLARIGLFQGSAERVQTGYSGPAPRMATRLMQAAHPGQALLSKELAERAHLTVTSLGKHRLRDLSGELALCRLDPPEGPLCEQAPRTLRVRNHNLPFEPNALLGRQVELEAIRALLSSGRRLVTLTGPGGIGKTRLALQVAAELTERFPDGVWFVSLTDAHTEEQLDAAIAEALGLEIRDHRVRFIETLAERQMLLVLDNFETVLPAARRVAQLLRQAPGLVCLVTSQIVLSLTGEWRFEVAPLLLAEAEPLFLERALQAYPTLSLSEDNQACVRRICQRVEGIPLAVELAAAQCRLLSLEEIEARLDNALTLLVTRTRDVPERQRTLRGALEWSFSLLHQKERQHFQRLAILPGSFTTEAAIAVCAEENLLEYLTSLEEKSLLRREESGRWRMLSIVRLFAGDCLQAEASDRATAEEGLLHYCSALAQRAAQHLDTPKEIDVFKELDADFEIIRASIPLMMGKSPQVFAEYILDLDFYLRRRRYLKELNEWCDLAISKIGVTIDFLFGKLLLVKSFVLRESGNNDDVLNVVNEVIGISLREGCDILYPESLSVKGIILIRLGEYEKALEAFEEIEQIYRCNKNTVRYVRNLNDRAHAFIRLEKFNEAERDLIESTKLGYEVGCTRDLCVTVSRMALLYYCNGEFDKWSVYVNKTIDMFLEVGDVLGYYIEVWNLMMGYFPRYVDNMIVLLKILKFIGVVRYYDQAVLYLRGVLEENEDILVRIENSRDIDLDYRDINSVDAFLRQEMKKLVGRDRSFLI